MTRESTRSAHDATLIHASMNMDKDSRDDFTFAKLSDLNLPVTFRMYVLMSTGIVVL